MATKNLARTVLEGGNTEEYRYERKQRNRKLRRGSRLFIRRVGDDPETCEERPVPVFPMRTSPGDRHTDKLEPVWKYLVSRVGRPWDDVHREIRERFDDRTLAGYHVVHAHLLKEVAAETDVTNTFSRFVVDAQGILRQREWKPWRMRRRFRPTAVPPSKAEIAAWLSGRVAAAVGDVVFWFVPTGKARPAYREQHERDPRFWWRSQRVVRMVWLPTYRQDRRLTVDECSFWDRLTPHQQDEIGNDLKAHDLGR